MLKSIFAAIAIFIASIFGGHQVAAPSQPAAAVAAVAQRESPSASSTIGTAGQGSPAIATTTIINQYITQPVIEHTIQTNTSQSLSQLQAQIVGLQVQINQVLNAQHPTIYSNGAPAVQTFLGNTFPPSLPSILGVADIPSLSSIYLPLAGGTLSGDLTLTGNLTVAGAQTLSGAITIPYLTATSMSVASSFQQLLVNGSTTLQSFTGLNATTSNATSTTLFATLGHFATGIIDSLTATAATITNLIATTITGTNATFTNATTTNATSTNAFATNLTATNGTLTNATSTTLFATSAVFTSSLSKIANGCYNADQYSTIQSAITAAGTSGCVNITSLTTDITNWFNPNALTIIDQRATSRVGQFLGGASVTPKLANFSNGSVANKKIIYFGNSTVWSATNWYTTMAKQNIAGGLLNGMNIHQDVQSVTADSSSNVTVVLGSPSGFTVGQFVSLYPTNAGLNICIGSGIVTDVSGNQFTFTGVGTNTECKNVTTTSTSGMASQQLLNFGENGATLAVLLADTSATGTGIGGICAVKPDLLIIRAPLINDVRLESTNLAQAKALVRQLLDTVRSCSPNTDILLKTENSLLTTDVGSHGYVVPNSSAQAYSTILEQAVTAFTNVYPNVFVLDTQTSLYGTTSPATSAYMGDQLHPSPSGHAAEAQEDIQVLTQLMNNGFQSVGTVDPNNPTAVPFSPYLAQNARASNYTQPWTLYSHACADPNYYTLVASGVGVMNNAAGQTYIISTFPSGARNVIQEFDVVEQQSSGCWQIPANSNTAASAANTQVNLGSPVTTPYPTYVGEQINIWRPKYIVQAAEPYVKNTTTYTYRRRVSIQTAGNGFFRIAFEPSEGISAQNSTIQKGDILYLNSNGLVSLSSCSFIPFAGILQCSVAGDQTALQGQYGWVFGTHPMEGQPDSTNHVLIGGSNKTPFATLSIWGSDALGTTAAFLVANSASTTVFNVNDAGSVGIGTSTPWGLLSIGPGASASTSPQFVSWVTGSSSPSFIVSSANNNGNVGIGTSSPTTALQINGSITPNVDNAFTDGNATYKWSAVYATNGTIQTSDARLKENVNNLSYGLADILKLRPVSFTWIAQPQQGTKLGFIAQEVQPILPETVNVGDDANHTLGLTYTEFVPIIVRAIQQLATTVAGFADNFVSAHITVTTADIHTANIQDANIQKLCVGSTCVTETQFKAMVAAAGQSSASADSGSSGDSAGSIPDTTPPTITINGDNPAHIHVGDSYADLGANVTDNVDQNLGLKYFLNGALVSNIVLDTSAAATDTIDYVATDQAGNAATSTRTVIVEAQASSPPAVSSATTSAATSTSQ
jgi:hypothetical protein